MGRGMTSGPPFFGLGADMTEHTHKQYDAELEEIRSRLLQMGGLVEAQITGAIDGLANGDLATLEQVIVRDVEVNKFEIELDSRHKKAPIMP